MSWTLKSQLEQRLNELQDEYQSGQKFLAELEARQTNVKETLLRIAGAIQVLEEELARANEAAPEEPPASPASRKSSAASNGTTVMR